MTNFVSPVSPVIEEVREVSQTWENDIFVPLSQNILGGVAVAGLGMAGVIAVSGAIGQSIDLYPYGIGCAMAGAVVTCVITIIRFFGDDLNIILEAYRTGVATERDRLMPRIAALELELSAAYDAQSAYEENGATAAIKKNQEIMERSRKDAAHILKIAFQGDKVTRAAMEQRGMGRHDFDRARNLLKAAGAMNGEGFIVATNPAQALQAIDEQFNADAKQGDNFATKW